MEKKRGEIAEKRERNGNLVIFSGGSTCAFSVNSPVIEKRTGLQVYNYGGAVPMGVRYIMASTFENAGSGDTIVLALETSFLTQIGLTGVKTLGLSLAMEEEDTPEKEAFGARGSSLEDTLMLRPGASFVATLYGKKILGYPLYRYKLSDFRSGGRLETDYRDEWLKAQKKLDQVSLSEKGIALLEQCKKLAAERNIKLYYSLPWTFTNLEFLELNRARNKKLLAEISKYVEVLEDSNLGAVPDAEYFADSLNHLNEAGSIERSKIIANSLERSK